MSGRYLIDMADVLRAAGVAVVEQDGWQNRARSSGGYASGRPWCVMWHHTASAPGANPANDAAYMSYNADAAPIANILLARDGVAWVLAAGATNTNGSGEGDIHTSRGVVPHDSMNTYAIGMEIQNSGVGEPYPQVQIDAAFKVSNALTAAYGLAANDVGTHNEYAPDRKIDPATTAAVQGPWRPASVTSSGTWSLDDVRFECARRAFELPPVPIPPPTGDDMATAILHVPGRNAQFIAQGPLLDDGTVHCLLITWYGPGPEGNPFLTDHAAAPDVIHQDTLTTTIQRDLVLVGDPEAITDSLWEWSAADFYRVVT